MVFIPKPDGEAGVRSARSGQGLTRELIAQLHESWTLSETLCALGEPFAPFAVHAFLCNLSATADGEVVEPNEHWRLAWERCWAPFENR